MVLSPKLAANMGNIVRRGGGCWMMVGWARKNHFRKFNLKEKYVFSYPAIFEKMEHPIQTTILTKKCLVTAKGNHFLEIN